MEMSRENEGKVRKSLNMSGTNEIVQAALPVIKILLMDRTSSIPN